MLTFSLIFIRPVGALLANHMDIGKIAFTGSALAGRAVSRCVSEVGIC